MPNLNRRFASAIVFLLVLAASVVIARADEKIKSRQTSQGQTTETTTMIKGKRSRTESGNGQIVTITQCDLRRDLMIMPQSGVYKVTKYDQPAAAPAKSSAGVNGPVAPPSKGGVITSTVTVKDTGERKQMFGYTARHLITTMVTTSSPDACTPMNSKMEMDGWYIDATFAIECDQARNPYAGANQSTTGCQDKYEMKTVGTAKRGYPVIEKLTMFDPNGGASFTTTNEVLEMSAATLDASLFDVPAGFREVDDFSQTMSKSGGSQSHQGDDGPSFNVPSSSADPSSTSGGMNTNLQNQANPANAPATGDVGAKREGVIRLGMAVVKTGAVGDGVNATDLAAAVRNTMVEYLKSPNIEVVQLELRLPAAIDAEAKQKECDFVIYTTVSHKKGGGGFGSMFGKIAPVMGNAIPMGGQGGAVASQVVYTAASASANVKPKDEITLDLRLQAPGSASAILTKQYKAKAQSAGQDIITPVVEPAAQAIVDQSASNRSAAVVR